jgi:hypothetical protein
MRIDRRQQPPLPPKSARRPMCHHQRVDGRDLAREHVVQGQEGRV